MSPEEEYRYFELPRVVSTTIVGGAAAVQVAKADPRRVVLIMGPNTGAGGAITVSTDPAGPPSTGYQLQNTTLPWVLYHKDHGALVQAEWFAGANAAGVIVVTTVNILRWPDEAGYGAALRMSRIEAAIERLLEVVRRLSQRENIR